jgi:hypothetical protein
MWNVGLLSSSVNSAIVSNYRMVLRRTSYNIPSCITKHNQSWTYRWWRTMYVGTKNSIYWHRILRIYSTFQLRSSILILGFIQSFWNIDFRALLYRHLLGLSRDVVLLSLKSSLDITTNSNIVGSLLIISILHIVVVVIIISVAHIAVASVITTANIIIVL